MEKTLTSGLKAAGVSGSKGESRSSASGGSLALNLNIPTKTRQISFYLPRVTSETEVRLREHVPERLVLAE